jgi:tetratricopeptide (TPR) repeat protein
MTIWISLSLLSVFMQGSVDLGSLRLTIRNQEIPYNDAVSEWRPTTGLGPQNGQILSFHYVPAMRNYQSGRYREAFSDLGYVIDRPDYISANPNRAYYLSTAYYARGMILLYHAEGVGRLNMAKSDLEAAIKWDEKNYAAHLELARLFLQAGLPAEAAARLRYLIDISPNKDVAEEAKHELAKLSSENPQ